MTNALLAIIAVELGAMLYTQVTMADIARGKDTTRLYWLVLVLAALLALWGALL